jgi:SAM-dependent methyltransferase
LGAWYCLRCVSDETAFDRYAASYDENLARGIAVSGEDRAFFAQGRIDWLKARLDCIGLRPRHILDFGCSSGETTARLRESFAADRVVGVDISEPLLARARRGYSGLRFENLGAVPARPQFELAYLNGVFHHIPRVEQAASARYLYERLSPGGVLAFWENNPWSPPARYVMSRIAFDREADMVWPHRARSLLRGAGFEIVRTDFVFVFPRFLRGLRALEPFLARIPLGAQFLVLGRRRSD